MLNILIDPISFKVTLFCTSVLYSKFLFSLMVQGGSKFKTGARPPEDV